MHRPNMRNLLTYIGIDRAVLYMLANRGWNLASGAITLLFIARFLSVKEQGYYFAFASLLAMQILFELGMSYVIMQFASHEMARLEWTPSGEIAGDPVAKGRLRSLLILVAKWYGVVALCLVVVVLPAGILFFSHSRNETEPFWQPAWIWLVLTAAFNIFTMPILSMLEGCEKIVEVARMRMYQSVLGSATAWVLLASGRGLLSLPAMNTSFLIVVSIWLFSTKRKFLRDLIFHTPRTVMLNWKVEIWPFQWKIAVSWLSGYFIFQIFVPILFFYRGPTEAGQFGMSMAISSALMSIAMAWMNAKAPGFGGLIAQGNYAHLDRIFSFALSRSMAVITMLGIGLIAANAFLHALQIPLAQRLLGSMPFAAIIFAAICNYFGYAQSTYLRAHKEEPLMLLSLAVAFLDCLLAFVFSPEYGATGVAYCFAAVSLLGNAGGGAFISSIKRKKRQQAAHDKQSFDYESQTSR